LIGKGISENTIRKHTQIARQFFHAAARRQLIEVNPFLGLKAAIQASPERFHFVSREDAKKVLEACPDADWRLIFALSRFGGLRRPSETLALTWDDVDWAYDRIRVPCVKTEHHAGKSFRWLPIFPELKGPLNDAWDAAPKGAVYVIGRYRSSEKGSNTNLRTQLNKIIRKAGLKPWEKLFQNLRSTRETELAEEFPMPAVCSWAGTSKAVDAKHCLQTTEEHFKKAITNPVQKTVQCDDVSASEEQGEKALNPQNPVSYSVVLNPTKGVIAGTGLAHAPNSKRKTNKTERGDVTHDALSQLSSPVHETATQIGRVNTSRTDALARVLGVASIADDPEVHHASPDASDAKPDAFSTVLSALESLSPEQRNAIARLLLQGRPPPADASPDQ
jgi:hypothetical protein